MQDCICHVEVKAISRSAGRSATAAVAYRDGEKIKDTRTGETFDYSRRSGVEHVQNILPKDISAAYTTSELWNAAEQAEKRINSTVAREYIIALPHELTPEARCELAVSFAAHIVEAYGVAANVAIHQPGKDGDSRNHHAHIITSTRVLTPEGFGSKTRILDGQKTGPEEVKKIRAAWAAMSNSYLEREGSERRMDARSFAGRGIEREPEVHLGPTAAAIERRHDRWERGGAGEKPPTSERGDLNRKIREANALIAERDALRAGLAAATEAERRKRHAADRRQRERLEAEKRFSEAAKKLRELEKPGNEASEGDYYQVFQAGMDFLSADISASGGGWPEARARLPHVSEAIRAAGCGQDAARRREKERGHAPAAVIPTAQHRSPSERQDVPDGKRIPSRITEEQSEPSTEGSEEKLTPVQMLRKMTDRQGELAGLLSGEAERIAEPGIRELERAAAADMKDLEDDKARAVSLLKRLDAEYDRLKNPDLLDRAPLIGGLLRIAGWNNIDNNADWERRYESAKKEYDALGKAMAGREKKLEADTGAEKSAAKETAARRNPGIAEELAGLETRIHDLRWDIKAHTDGKHRGKVKGVSEADGKTYVTLEVDMLGSFFTKAADYEIPQGAAPKFVPGHSVEIMTKDGAIERLRDLDLERSRSRDRGMSR